MAETCYTVNVRCRLDVEDHAGAQDLIGKRMNPRLRVVVDGGVTDAVSCCVAKRIAKAMFRHNSTCGRVYGTRCRPGMDCSKRGASGFGYRCTDMVEFLLRLASQKRSRDVGPEA